MSDYIEMLVNAKLRAMKTSNNVYERGRVTKVHDYILEVSGLESASFYERVVIGGRSLGYVNAINRDSVTVAVVKSVGAILVGDEVVTTGQQFSVRFSEEAVGHITDIFGEDLLMGERFANVFNLPIETPPIPIMERGTVNRPLYTGIAGIDLIYPIGFGQRQLIIGDKKTGKTQILLDTIANQARNDVLCIYVAINKPKKLVKEIYESLAARGAMDYTIILASFNDNEAPVSFFTPYAALSIAEHYMRKEKRDVLVCIDDLSAHADCHREISLLAGKTPGRDAYPPDIFYTHSRMLEKGCQHKDGGSITILPVVETKGGDISGYISTNIISITDGQLVLSRKAFENGEKPAIHYGLSVSRLGGAVQAADMRRLGSRVRREYLSYLETKEVYQLANLEEMGPEMQKRFAVGKEYETRLRQYKFSPRSKDEILQQFQQVLDM